MTINDTIPPVRTSISREAIEEMNARRERLNAEYDEAVALARRHGTRLLGNAQVKPFGCFYLEVGDEIELKVMAGSGLVDANDLTPEQSAELARRMSGRVESLVAFVETVAALCCTPNHRMPATATHS